MEIFISILVISVIEAFLFWMGSIIKQKLLKLNKEYMTRMKDKKDATDEEIVANAEEIGLIDSYQSYVNLTLMHILVLILAACWLAGCIGII